MGSVNVLKGHLGKELSQPTLKMPHTTFSLNVLLLIKSFLQNTFDFFFNALELTERSKTVGYVFHVFP